MKKRILKSGLRYLSRHKFQSFFMVLGITLGVIFLSITFSFGYGIEKQIMNKVKKFFGADNIFLMAGKDKNIGGPGSDGPTTTLKMEDMDAIINTVKGVHGYDPIQSIPQCDVIYGNTNISTTIKGRSVEGEYIWHRTVTEGEYFSKADEINTSRVALLGSKIAQQLFGNKNPVGEQIRIGNVMFNVKGVLEAKGTDPHGSDLDLEIIVPITTMMNRLMNVDYISGAKLEINEAEIDVIAGKIKTILRERHSINLEMPDDFNLITPQQVKDMSAKLKKTLSLYLPLAAAIVMILGGFIISILMIMSVNRRVSEIGLRKAVGANSKSIMLQFFSESVIISLSGGIIGLIIGIVGTWFFSVKMGYTFFIPWQTIAFGVLLPVLVGILAGIIPARKAANLDLVKALS